MILTSFAILARLYLSIRITEFPAGMDHFTPSKLGYLDVCLAAVPEPIPAGVISILLLGEMLSALQVLCSLLVITSIILLQWKKEGQEQLRMVELVLSSFLLINTDEFETESISPGPNNFTFDNSLLAVF